MIAETPEVVQESSYMARVEALLAKKRSQQGGEERPKKGKKIKQPEPEPEQPQGVDVAAMTDMYAPIGYAILAPIIDRWTPEQPYTQEEAQMLAGAVAAVGAKYPGFDYMEETALVLVLMAQFGSRYMASMARPKLEPGHIVHTEVEAGLP